MSKKDDKLFTCCICSKVIEDNTTFDVVCCSLSPDLESLFPKYDEGRVTSILLGGEVISCGVPAKDSEAAMSGADVTFLCCGDSCRKAIEEILENSGLNVERVERGES